MLWCGISIGMVLLIIYMGNIAVETFNKFISLIARRVNKSEWHTFPLRTKNWKKGLEPPSPGHTSAYKLVVGPVPWLLKISKSVLKGSAEFLASKYKPDWV